jgi:two-component sensor histidine kinase
MDLPMVRAGTACFTPMIRNAPGACGATALKQANLMRSNIACGTIAAFTAGYWVAHCPSEMFRGLSPVGSAPALAELVSRELSHRIKNIFAVIAGLIGISSPKNADAAAYAKEVSGRIAALGRAHNFARPHGPESAILQNFGGLHGLLSELMSPYDHAEGRRYAISGQDVAVGDRSATPLALLIHELATNAVKYGALSEGKGRIAISTELRGDQVVIIWSESDGPTVTSPPAQTGFGTQLSDISIVSQLGGALDRAWNPEGLKVTISIPKAHL